MQEKNILREMDGMKKHRKSACLYGVSHYLTLILTFALLQITGGAPFEQHTSKSWDRVMDLNVKSVFFCVQK